MSYVIVEPHIMEDCGIKTVGDFVDLVGDEYLVGFFLPNGDFYVWTGYQGHMAYVQATELCSYLNGGKEAKGY